MKLYACSVVLVSYDDWLQLQPRIHLSSFMVTAEDRDHAIYKATQNSDVKQRIKKGQRIVTQTALEIGNVN